MNLNKFKNLQSPYILILVGPPLSGKSVFCREFLSDIDGSVEIISRDQIVLDVYGSDDYNTAFRNVNQKEVDRLLHIKMKEANSGKKNAIIDMTHMSSKRRRNNLSYFSDDYTKIGIIFPHLSSDEYQRRNDKRSSEEKKTIPMSIVNQMVSQYQPVSNEEGFNRVISL